MVVLRNNFTLGPDGADIRLIAGGEDDPFDVWNDSATQAATILKFKSAEGLARPTAEYVMRCATGAVGNYNTYVGWYTSFGVQTQFWTRFYCRFPTLPDNTLSPLMFQALDVSTGNYRCDIGCYRAGGAHKLFSENAAGTLHVETVSDIIEDAWFRVEARFQVSTTTGNGEVRYYEEADADLLDYTEALTFSNWNLGGADASYFILGSTVPDANVEDVYFSGFALSTEGWIGPEPFRPGKGSPGILTNATAIHTSTW